MKRTLVPVPLREPRFRRLWFGSITIAFSEWLERLALGWLVLELTNSIFLSTLAFAVRNMPSMFLGLFSGAVADLFPRQRLIGFMAGLRAVTMLSIGGLALGDGSVTWVILVLAAVGGATRTVEVPATQALISDIFGRDGTPRAIGVHGFGVRMISLFGALAAGFSIQVMGSASPFFLGAMFLLLGAVLVWGIPALRPPRPRWSGLWRETTDGVRIMRKTPVVMAVLMLAFMTEIFGFSYSALLPGFADRSMNVGPAGLGTLTFASGIGALLGMAIVASYGFKMVALRTVIVVMICFGCLLVGLASMRSLSMALLMLVGIGTATALLDAMGWALLQRHVPDEMRGRVLGAWIWAISFGWIGALLLGAVGEIAGVDVALRLGGVVVCLVAAIGAFWVRRLALHAGGTT